MKSVTAFCLAIPAIFLIYKGLEKERLPYMEHNDALMKIDWNAGISVEENDVRVGGCVEAGGRTGADFYGDGRRAGFRAVPYRRPYHVRSRGLLSGGGRGNLASGAGEDKKLHGGTLSARHGGVRRVRQYFRFDILQ